MRKFIMAVLVAVSLSACVYSPTVFVNSDVTVAPVSAKIVK